MNLRSKLLLSLGVRWIQSLRPRFVESTPLPPSGILVLWHEHMLLCLPAFAHQNMRVLIPQSRDGEWGAVAAQRLDYSVVRGSSSRGGVDALRKLADDLSKNGGWVALVVDGPRGPRQVSKPGAVWLSERTGLPVVAVSAKSSMAVRLKSWDRCVVPMPFAKIFLQTSKPFFPKQTREVDGMLGIL